MKFKKIDIIIIVILLVISTLFLSKAEYIGQLLPFQPEPPEENITTPLLPVKTPIPPTSLVPAYRRDVSPADEGVHFNKIRTSREWWYFNAVFDHDASQLQDWVVAISFNHMARGDLLGTNKPDLLVVTLLGNNSETYGGLINKEHYMGILREGTLIAGSPGVKVSFDNSWAEGSYPNWHVHARGTDVDTSQQIIIDLDYTAKSLPIWTLGSKAFDKSESEVANYIILGCEVSGTVTINGKTYTVKGTGAHEHAWTPKTLTTLAIGGWDWFSISLQNGWSLYASNYLPNPHILSEAASRIDPFGTLLITNDKGETLTELKNVNLRITRQDEKIFPLVKLPAAFSVTASPSINPLYLISQSLLYGTKTTVQANIDISHSINKIWKFPTYMGMKIGYVTINGVISWSDDDGLYEVPIQGVGVSWSMRAFL